MTDSDHIVPALASSIPAASRSTNKPTTRNNMCTLRQVAFPSVCSLVSLVQERLYHARPRSSCAHAREVDASTFMKAV